MKRTIRTFAVVACAVALFGSGGTAVADPAPAPPPVGSQCGKPGENKVITTIHTCATINSNCTGYDMMIIGRVDKWGHCVIPGVNGTTW
ncbi:hypothetical protein FK268_18525 [Tsukamurella sputi]|uniref:DUF2282 domain-containing protein n=1 Tax=Tsukamurella sputi TaxID=2591848 RepID=A0A5C5RI58_9ACTN|nr:hypothetical protein [Tsukamurella sputi]TWS22719.1 hypothetical protein FK268_18525 [Tsukamurella sputi]